MSRKYLDKEGLEYYHGLVEEELETYAKNDGYYEDMSVGRAENLIPSTLVSDSTPYLFRTSGGSLEIGDRETVNAITGGSVVWNQLVENGDFVDTSVWSANGNASFTVDDGVGTITVTNASGYDSTISQNIQTLSNHKYLISCEYKTDTEYSDAIFSMQFGDLNPVCNVLRNGLMPITDWTKVNVIVNANIDHSKLIVGKIGKKDTMSNNETIFVRGIQLFDFTQIFGSTIADYIYSLEQANAGAGVAWFKKYFPKPYYDYDPGTFKHVEGLVSHDLVGFNLLNLDRTEGTLSGADVTNLRDFDLDKYYVGLSVYGNYYPNRITSYAIDNQRGAVTVTPTAIDTGIAFPVKVVPGATYYINYAVLSSSSRISVTAYDENGAYISGGLVQDWNHYKFVAPDNASICCIIISGTANTTTNVENLNLNLSYGDARDGDYEPYVKHSYPLDSNVVLRGIPKLDSANKLYYDGDTYEPDGTVTRRYKVKVLDGTENWRIASNSYIKSDAIDAYCTDSDLPTPNPRSSSYILLSNKLTPVGAIIWEQTGYPDSVVLNDDQIHCNIANSKVGITDYTQETRQTALSKFTAHIAAMYEAGTPYILLLPLKTPTTETAEPYHNPQIVDNYGTEEFVIDDEIDVPIPVGHVTQYQPDLVAKLEVMPSSPSDDGLYLLKQENGNNIYYPFSSETIITTAEVTLAAASWSNNTQTVNVTGVKADNSVIVAPNPASTDDYVDAGIICSAQALGTLTFTCDTVPTDAITVNVMIVG